MERPWGQHVNNVSLCQRQGRIAFLRAKYHDKKKEMRKEKKNDQNGGENSPLANTDNCTSLLKSKKKK